MSRRCNLLMIPIWAHCASLSSPGISFHGAERRGFIQCGRVTGELEPWWDGMIRFCLSCVSRVSSPSRIKDSLIGLWTPHRCYQLTRKNAREPSFAFKTKKCAHGYICSASENLHIQLFHGSPKRVRWLKECKPGRNKSCRMTTGAQRKHVSLCSRWRGSWNENN